MKAQKQINVYYFSELSEEVQNKVHDKNKYFLTEVDSFYFKEHTREFENFVEFIGGRFTDDFVGYDIVSNRVVAEWNGDLKYLFTKIDNGEIKDDCSYLQGEKLPELKIGKRLLDIIQSDFYYSKFKVRNNKVTVNVCNTDLIDEIKEELERLYDWVEEVVNIINNRFLNNLRAEEEYLESEEAFAEYCEANEVLFTAEGVQVN